jgi:enoyl-[acyl-carrier protein] reductase II
MQRTRVCDLLDIAFPILQGGMLWIATAELAAAVSNAGALGLISPLAGMEKQGDPVKNFKGQLSKMKQLTPKPFGVNILLDLSYADALMAVALSEKVKIVITAAGNPARFTGVLKNEGVTLLHVVGSIKQAQKAESCGVNAVIAEGIEAAAHNAADELPLFALIPQVVDEISIPVIAAGGIADARGMVAAFSLGAEGVQLGTRFIAVNENAAHPNYKQAIIDAKDTDTVITNRSIVPTRCLKTEFTNTLIELERSGATAEDIMNFIGYRSNRTAQVDGNLNGGEAYCGASAGLVKEILPAKDVVRQLVEEYEQVLKRLNK